MSEPLKRYRDFAPQRHAMEGKRVDIDEVVNREIVVMAVRIEPSKFERCDQCTTVQFRFSDEPEIPENVHIFWTGSSVLADQFKQSAEFVPFLATVKKINKYYSLT